MNVDIVDYVNSFINAFNEDIQQYPDSYTSLNINYDVLTNSPQWFTLKITVLNTVADSFTQYKFYNLDRLSGKLVNIGDIFADGIDYVKVLSDNIKEQMRWIMKHKEGAIYFIKDKENDGFDQIKKEQERAYEIYIMLRRFQYIRI
ncbi:MAG: hypothetical protein IKL07_01060 [Clostridium sp.]|nr:hypothetical protein [Clostridium sp.]